MAKTEKYKLLVIEDDNDLAEVIEKHFTTQGYSVEIQPDALGPLSRLRKNPDKPIPWDVVLTDLMMPGIDGIEFIREMKILAPTLPVVLMTAHGGLETAVRAVKEGAYDFVTKPLNFSKLAISIERATSFYELQRENLALREVLQTGTNKSRVIAKSPAMKAICDLVSRIAKSSATVLITGESGAGKEVVAKAIHEQSDRNAKPFIAINCAAIPETLLESELFGFAKGSFTGAIDKKIGLFEEAEGGTLFLDEIGDLTATLQAKLLRVLQERTIKRIGENQSRAVDVRVLAATHKNLTLEVQEKRFREDLFFRLNVIPIRIPPLRERREDILPLADHFLKKFVVANRSAVAGFSKAALENLARLPWQGNVRELENTIERAVVLCQTTQIEPCDLSTLSDFDTPPPDGYTVVVPTPSAVAPSVTAPGQPVLAAPDVAHLTQALPAAKGDITFSLLNEFIGDNELPTLNTLQLRYIDWVVSRVGGVREKARRILDIDRKTLYKKLREFHEGDSSPEPDDASASASTTALSN